MYVIQSLRDLYQNGYTSFCSEKTIAQKDEMQRNAHALITNDLQSITEHARKYPYKFLEYALHAELTRHSFYYVYADHTLLTSKRYAEITEKSYQREEKIIEENHKKRLNTFFKGLGNIDPAIRKTIEMFAQFHMFGPKTFDTFLKAYNTSLNPEEQKICNDAGNIYKRFYTELEDISLTRCLYEARIPLIAKNIAATYQENPRQKVFSLQNDLHLETLALDKKKDSIGSLLQEKYHITPTCVLFTTAQRIKHAHQQIMTGIDLKFLNTEEVLPFSEPVFTTRAIETYFAITNPQITQGVHSLPKALGYGAQSYVVVLPDMKHEEALDQIITHVRGHRPD